MEIITIDQPRICKNILTKEPSCTGFLAKLFPTTVTVYDIYIIVHLPEKNIEHYSQKEYTKPESLQFKQLKQDVLNQYLKNGYRAPQNEIAKFLLYNCFQDMTIDSNYRGDPQLYWGPFYVPLGPSLMMTKGK